jgi:hypothetical protein
MCLIAEEHCLLSPGKYIKRGLHLCWQPFSLPHTFHACVDASTFFDERANTNVAGRTESHLRRDTGPAPEGGAYNRGLGVTHADCSLGLSTTQCSREATGSTWMCLCDRTCRPSVDFRPSARSVHRRTQMARLPKSTCKTAFFVRELLTELSKEFLFYDERYLPPPDG